MSTNLYSILTSGYLKKIKINIERKQSGMNRKQLNNNHWQREQKHQTKYKQQEHQQ